MKPTIVAGLLLCVATNTLASPLELEGLEITKPSIQEKGQTIHKELTNVVKLLKEVGKEDPAFGQPLARATLTIETLNRAIEGIFQQYKYKQGGTNPTGGYKSGGPRYGGSKPGGY